MGTVINSLSSSLSKAHKAHCPKKDISYRVFIVFHFQKAVKHPDRIKVRCWDETSGMKNNNLFCQVQTIMFQLSQAFIRICHTNGRNICDPLVSSLSQRSCSLSPSVAPKLTPVRQEQWVTLPLTRHNYNTSPPDFWSCLLKPASNKHLIQTTTSPRNYVCIQLICNSKYVLQET